MWRFPRNGGMARESAVRTDRLGRMVQESAARADKLEEDLSSLTRTVKHFMETEKTGGADGTPGLKEPNSRGRGEPAEKLVTFADRGEETSLRSDRNYYSRPGGAPDNHSTVNVDAEVQQKKDVHSIRGALEGLLSSHNTAATGQRNLNHNVRSLAKPNKAEERRPAGVGPAFTPNSVDWGNYSGQKLSTPWSITEDLPTSLRQSTRNTNHKEVGASCGLAGGQPGRGASFGRNILLPLPQETTNPGLSPAAVPTPTPPELIEQWKQECYSQGLMEGIGMMRKEMLPTNPQTVSGDNVTPAWTTGAGSPLNPVANPAAGGSQPRSPGRKGRKRNGRRRRRDRGASGFNNGGSQSDSDGSDTSGGSPSPGPYSRRMAPPRMDIEPLDNKAAFNGTHWKGFICLLEELASENNWNETVKLRRFRKALKGPASDFFSTLPPSARRDYNLLKTRFQQHYAPKELPIVARWKALSANQRADETIYEFKVRVDELLQNATENTDETLGMEVFLKGLLDKDLALVAFQQNPNTLEDAYRAVTSMVSLRKGLGAARKTSRLVKLDDSDDENTSLLRTVREMTVAFQRMGERTSGNKTPDNVSQGRMSPKRGCFNCGQGGHFKAECQSPNRLCYNCGSSSHFQRDCMVPRKCHACGSQSHYIKDCPRYDSRNDHQRGTGYSPRGSSYRTSPRNSPSRGGYRPSYQPSGGSPSTGRYQPGTRSYQSWRDSPRGGAASATVQ